MTDNNLQAIKDAVEKRILETLTNGELRTDREGNEQSVPPSAAFLNVARQYLKDFYETDSGIMNTGAAKGVLKKYQDKVNLPYSH